MSRNTWWAKLMRIVGIVLLSLTAAFTLMGGAGTSCVALNPTGFGGKFAKIAPYQWLWILFVLLGIAIGIWGVSIVVSLVRGKRNAYRNAVIALICGTVLNAVHMFASRALRGSSMPVDMVLYTNILTLVIFLLFRLPGIWQGVNFEKLPDDKTTGKFAVTFALAGCGLLSLSVQFMFAADHVINGINYADEWHAAFTIIGITLLAAAIAVGVFVEGAVRQTVYEGE